jgi:chaperonin GroES
MGIKPLQDRIVIKCVEEDQVSAGGIIIPDSAKEKPVIGEVIAVGPGKTSDNGAQIAMDVKVGDKVLFGKYAGTEFSHEGQDLKVMRLDDVFGVIN